MKIFTKIIIFVLAVIVLGFLFYNPPAILFSPALSQPKACFNSPVGENCFFVELAKTEAEQEKGLMFRNNLDADKGMLFVFEKEGIYPFWMKNTLIPLDIIWISENGKVVFIKERAAPCGADYCPLISPGAYAKYVLEVNAGLSEKYNIKTGDNVDISS